MVFRVLSDTLAVEAGDFFCSDIALAAVRVAFSLICDSSAGTERIIASMAGMMNLFRFM